MSITIVVRGKDVTPTRDHKNILGKVCGEKAVIIRGMKNGKAEYARCEKHVERKDR